MTRRPDAIEEKKRAARSLRQAHQFEAAIATLRGALAGASDDLELHLELGDLLLRRKRPAEAAEALTRALELEPKSPADLEKLLVKRAEASWALGKLDAAFADLKRCAELSPTAPQLPLRAARAALARGDQKYVESLIETWSASEKEDDNARACFLAGLRAFSARRYVEAAESFEKGGAAGPGEALSPRAYAALAKGLGFLSRSKA